MLPGRGVTRQEAAACWAEEVGLGAVVQWLRWRGFAVPRLRRLERVNVGRLDQALRHLVVRIAYGATHVGGTVVRVYFHLVVILLEKVGARRSGCCLFGLLAVASVTRVLRPAYGVANIVPATP